MSDDGDTRDYACTLDETTAVARADQVAALTDRLLRRERTDDQLVLRFEPGDETSRLVEEFIRDERRCCAFFDFEVTTTDTGVVLTLSAPAGAGHMLDAAMVSFEPDTDPLILWHEQRARGTVDPRSGPS